MRIRTTLPAAAGLVALSAAAAPAAAPDAAGAYTLRETPTELRLETPRYALAVTREGFAWTLFRGGAVVLQSAPATGATANGLIPFPDGNEQPTKIKSVERAADRVVIEYEAKRKKTALRVE